MQLLDKWIVASPRSGLEAEAEADFAAVVTEAAAEIAASADDWEFVETWRGCCFQ